MTTTKVRTTIRPLEEIEVEPEELVDLQRLGILLDSKATTEDGLQKAAEKQSSQGSPDDAIEGQV